MKLYQVDFNKIILRDYLANDRTLLANERTLLSFVRTAIAIVGSAMVCIKLVDDPFLYLLGIVLLIISALILVYGTYSYWAVHKRLSTIIDNDLIKEEIKEQQIHDTTI